MKTKKLGLKIGTITFLVLSVVVVLFPIEKTPAVTQVDFVRNIDQLKTNTHGAANQWDYLFEDNTQTYTGQLGSTGTQTVTNTPATNNDSGLLNTMQQGFVQATSGSTGGTYQGTFTSTEKGMMPTSTTTKPCTTPRGQVLQDKDFVLAYQQRTDVGTVCNVERRVCTDGALEGSYIQRSCKENVTYDYKKTQVVSYNEPVINPLVQPGPASNAGGNFSTEGKVNQTKEPTNMRGNTSTSEPTTTNPTSQTIVVKANCMTPWGTELNHGQFVKAYKTSLGLIDMPCETELRLCVNGELKGSYVNATCQFKNMTYNDYMAGNRDITKPTPEDITSTLTDDTSGFNLFDRFRNLLQ